MLFPLSMGSLWMSLLLMVGMMRYGLVVLHIKNLILCILGIWYLVYITSFGIKINF